MEAVGEPMSIGGFSNMEYYILVICSIVQSLMSNDWDWEQAQDINVSEVSTMYHHIRELAQTLKLDLALFEQTQERIDKLLHKTAFKWDVFRQQNRPIRIMKK